MMKVRLHAGKHDLLTAEHRAHSGAARYTECCFPRIPENCMQHVSAVSILAGAALLAALAPAEAVKRVSYPEVKVAPLAPFKGDPALEEARKKISAAVGKQELDTLLSFVDPKFLWVSGGKPVEEFDANKDAAHNFKVAFGFRGFGKDADGKTDIGPQWFLLELFLADPSLTQEQGSPLVCGPATARLTDVKAFEQALDRVDEEQEPAEWVFALSETPLTAKPGSGGNVGKIASNAMPVLGFHPPIPANAPPTQPPSHFELLMPNGKTGWAEAKNLRALFVDRLCYAKDDKGEWKINLFEQAE